MEGTTPRAGTGEMLQQFRAFATLEENQVWFPIPTWQLTTLQVSITVVPENPASSLASLDTIIYIVHRHT